MFSNQTNQKLVDIQIQAQQMEFTGTLIDGGGNIWRYKNGIIHCDHGPAVEHKNGYTWWVVNGQNHRLDGMAVIYPYENETKVVGAWYVNGQRIEVGTQQEFEQMMRLKAFW